MGFQDEFDEEYLDDHGAYTVKVDKKITIDVNRDLHKKLKIISSAKGLSLDKTISLLIEDKIKTIDIVKIVESSLENSNDEKLSTMEERIEGYEKIRKEIRENYKGSKKVTITVDAGIHKKLKIIASSQEISLPMVIEPMLEEKVNEIDIVKLVEESLS